MLIFFISLGSRQIYKTILDFPSFPYSTSSCCQDAIKRSWALLLVIEYRHTRHARLLLADFSLATKIANLTTLQFLSSSPKKVHIPKPWWYKRKCLIYLSIGLQIIDVYGLVGNRKCIHLWFIAIVTSLYGSRRQQYKYNLSGRRQITMASKIIVECTVLPFSTRNFNTVTVHVPNWIILYLMQRW